MTLPFIFCSLVSNLRRVLARPTRNNRLARLRSFGNAFPTFKIGAKVRDVSPGKTRSKRSLKNRTVRPFFPNVGNVAVPALEKSRRTAFVRRRFALVGAAPRPKRGTRADKAKNTVL